MTNGGSQLHSIAGWVGTGVSGTFLYLIAALNLVVLLGIVKVFREMRAGAYSEAELEQQLNSRGLMNRFLGLHASDHQALADVPARAAVRPGL